MSKEIISGYFRIFNSKTMMSILFVFAVITILQIFVIAQEKINHPRLLIREHDPLTGLDALKLRYRSGMRPSDDIAGWALSYLLTGDENFARRAVDEMNRTHVPEKVGSRTYMDYVRWSLAFDWLYNYKGFDDTLKNRIAEELLKGAEKMLADDLMVNPKAVMYHNYTVRYLTLASFALAAIENYPAVEARAKPLRERTREAFDNILDLTNFTTPDGSFQESMDYARITFLPMVLMAELRRTTSGDDPARRFTFYPHLIDTYLYKVLPNGTTSRSDDQEWPYFLAQDNDVLGYMVNRFKDPYAAWMLRESGWSSTKNWYIPILQFLWNDTQVAPRNPALANAVELPRTYLFRGIGDFVMRNGWEKDSTLIEFNCGPYLAKHQHLDQNQFTIYHDGYLAIDSGADYTDIESPHYLNYYRRTIAHNTMLVYDPKEKFFWGQNLLTAANDGGQRMDSSRYWNSVRSRRDFAATSGLWNLAEIEASDYVPDNYSYVRGNATHAYSAAKLDLFTRELLYTPQNNVLVVFDRVHSTNPDFKKVWLLHGVNEPKIEAEKNGKDTGNGGTLYSSAKEFTFEDGGGRLRVHPLLPLEKELIKRGGSGWEFWTPGDDKGGNWGTGRNWPLEPFAGGDLPADPYLQNMWHTFWGNDFNHLLQSNQRDVVPGAWRIEITPAKPAKDDMFLNVLEIGNVNNASNNPWIELIKGDNLTGAIIENNAIALFSTGNSPLTEGQITIPDIKVKTLIVTGLKPEAKYQVQFTGDNPKSGESGASVLKPENIERANQSGIIQLFFDNPGKGKIRFKLLN